MSTVCLLEFKRKTNYLKLTFMALTCQSKITDFNNVLFTDETVTCGKITVYETLGLEVFHGSTDLLAHLNQCLSVRQKARLVTSQVLQQCPCKPQSTPG